MTPEEMVSRLLYRDGLMLIIDKPAGLSVHRGPKGGPSLEDHFDVLRFGLPRRPSLAHRLDKETSGCLVLGRHRKALAVINDLFRHGKVGKTYWAVVQGGPDADEGRIDLPLGRLDDTRGWWMKPDPGGLPSTTTWKVMGRFSDPAPEGGGSPRSGGVGSRTSSALEQTPPGASGATLPLQGRDESAAFTWLALEPLTGRTHQLRVHCAAMGWAILGDNIYGNAPRFGGPGLHLHAREIAVPLYKNREPIRITAPVPPHVIETLKACGWNGEAERAAAAPARAGQ